MNNLKEYIIEKFKLSKDTVSNNISIVDIEKFKNKLQNYINHNWHFNKNDIHIEFKDDNLLQVKFAFFLDENSKHGLIDNIKEFINKDMNADLRKKYNINIFTERGALSINIEINEKD